MPNPRHSSAEHGERRFAEGDCFLEKADLFVEGGGDVPAVGFSSPSSYRSTGTSPYLFFPDPPFEPASYT